MSRHDRPSNGQNRRGGKRQGAGRPRGSKGRPTAFKQLRELVRSGTEESVRTIANMMNDESNSPRLRFAAAKAIPELAYGKPRDGEAVEPEVFPPSPDPPPEPDPPPDAGTGRAKGNAGTDRAEGKSDQNGKAGSARDKMAANPFTRGTAPGRARPRHRGSFATGHVKHGGRQKGTPNAISARVRNAIAAAVRHVLRGTGRNRNHWQWLIEKNPLINEARQRQGLFTLAGPPRVRSRAFSEKAFNADLSAVALAAIETDQFVDKDLVECLTLLFKRDSTAIGRFVFIAAPKQGYLAARPHPEMIEPREPINPGARRVRPIPEWTLGYEPKGNSYSPVPVDPALTPEQGDHEIAGSPRDPKPGWAWLFDCATRRFFAIDLRPRSPIDEWTRRVDPKLGMIPVPVDPTLTVQDASHRDYGSPLDPAPGFTWLFNSRTERYLPAIADEPGDPCGSKSWFAKLRYRWHSDAGHYSLVHRGDGDGEDTLYEYDTERHVFKRHQPSLEPGPETPWRRRFHLRRPDGSYTDLVYDYDAQTTQLVRVTK